MGGDIDKNGIKLDKNGSELSGKNINYAHGID